MSCTTHHMCNCTQEKLIELEKERRSLVLQRDEACRVGEEFRKENRRLTDSCNKLNLEIVAQAERVRGLERKIQEISDYNGEITARSMDQETENARLREALEWIWAYSKDPEVHHSAKAALSRQDAAPKSPAY